MPTPEPTPEPTAEPGAEPTETPNAEPTAAPETQTAAPSEEAVVTVTETPAPQETADGSQDLGFWPGLVIGLVLGGMLIALLTRLLRGRGGEKRSPAGKRMKVTSVQGLGARKDQQDSLYATEPEQYREQGILLCVADGMGGLSNGSIISKTAVSAVANKFKSGDKSDPERLLAAMVQSANSAVNMLLSPNIGSGGTTLLLGLVKDDLFYFASVGDSRICLLRDGEFIHLNRPHIFEDELLLRHVNGEISYDQARTYQKRGALTSFLGMGSLKYLDIPSFHIRLQSGDRIILMSDGVFNALSDRELAAILRRSPASFADRISDEVEKKHNPYQDNYTALILAVS